LFVQYSKDTVVQYKKDSSGVTREQGSEVTVMRKKGRQFFFQEK